MNESSNTKGLIHDTPGGSLDFVPTVFCFADLFVLAGFNFTISAKPILLRLFDGLPF